MKIKILLFLLTGAFISNSCKSDDTDTCCVNLEMDMDIRFINGSGDNITNQEDGIELRDIAVYNKEGEDWVVSSNQPILVDRENEDYIRIFASDYTFTDQISETRIDFEDGTTDYIKTQLYKNGKNSIILKVWYNDVLEWDAKESDDDRYFDIEK
ncbi:hypothetical protein [Robertkochia solimangrovi]|uniref:hypothetical protein n=1 Tax=Robertkochia solimangrovi TaxID=2213046 RepID=UPI00117E53CD|nr:hypothetical protein [Robertkochia solimangrovi]TRZ43186.1 hypothetical protein DMZ48_10865 [Robertkochia solimangrovi]